MTDASSASSPSAGPPEGGGEPDHASSRAAVAMLIIGLFACLVGFLDGAVMASKREIATCPTDGITPPTCYSHPQAGLGIGLMAVCTALAMLLVLVVSVANSLLRALSTADSAAID